MAQMNNLDQYIDYFFMENEANWHKSEDDGRFTYTRVEARPCRESDFGNDPEQKKAFHLWDGFLTVCPN